MITRNGIFAGILAIALAFNSVNSYAALATANPVIVKNAFPYGTIAITAATTTGGITGTFTTSDSIQTDSVICSNAGSVTVFIAFGIGSATAAVPTTETQGATPILAGAIMAFTKGIGADKVAAITGSSTATLYCTAVSGS